MHKQNKKHIIPNIPDEDLRKIKQIFLNHFDEDRKEKIVNDLRDLISPKAHDIVNKQTYEEFSEEVNKTPQEQIYFDTFCSLLSDLVDTNWDVSIGLKGFNISQPSSKKMNSGESIDKIKSNLRESQLANRDQQLKKPEVRRFIQRMERPRAHGNEMRSVLDLVDDGQDLFDHLVRYNKLPDEDKSVMLEKLFKPKLVPIYPDEKERFLEIEKLCPHTGLRLSDIWRYFRHTWSTENLNVPGRSFPFLIRNEARPLSPIIGILMLRSASKGDGNRDEWVGWSSYQEFRSRIPREIDADKGLIGLIKSLDVAIANIKVDDFTFIQPGDIKRPTDELIETFKKIYVQENEKRSKELEEENKPKKRTDGSIDYETKSEESLFRKKRAFMLVRLLSIRKIFNKYDYEKDPVTAFAKMSLSKEGRQAIDSSLVHVRSAATDSQIADVAVCGAIAPYNVLLGGKLSAMLCASKEMQDFYENRYKGQISYIASCMAGKKISKPSKLLFLTTTSLYGIASSQYNRLKFKKDKFDELEKDIEWIELRPKKENMTEEELLKLKKEGNESYKLSQGIGTYHLRDFTSKMLQAITKKYLGRRLINYQFGEGTSPKLRLMKTSLMLLDLASKGSTNDSNNSITQFLLTHGLRRINYILPLVSNVLGYVFDPAKYEKEKNISPTVETINKVWIKRWLSQRTSNEEILEQLKTLGKDTVSSSVNFPIDENDLPLFKDQQQVGSKM